MTTTQSNGCPIPLPSGIDGGTVFGRNRPLPFPDLTLGQLSGVDLLDGQIIIQLQNTRCTRGISQSALLRLLQNTYPQTNWNSNLLQRRLLIGKRRGRFCQAGNSLWVLRSDMVHVNYQNQKFQGLTSSIERIPIRQTAVAKTFTGVYDGNLPDCRSILCGVPRITTLIPQPILDELERKFRGPV